MSKADIEKRKGRSKVANSKFSPWTSDYEEMAKKTVVRHMWKYLPISVEVQQQVAYDEGTGKDISKIKDVTPDDTMLEAPDYELLDVTDENTEVRPSILLERSKLNGYIYYCGTLCHCTFIINNIYYYVY